MFDRLKYFAANEFKYTMAQLSYFVEAIDIEAHVLFVYLAQGL